MDSHYYPPTFWNFSCERLSKPLKLLQWWVDSIKHLDNILTVVTSWQLVFYVRGCLLLHTWMQVEVYTRVRLHKEEGKVTWHCGHQCSHQAVARGTFSQGKLLPTALLQPPRPVLVSAELLLAVLGGLLLPLALPSYIISNHYAESVSLLPLCT